MERILGLLKKVLNIIRAISVYKPRGMADDLHIKIDKAEKPESIFFSAASRVRDCRNPANLVALAQIRALDREPDGTRSSRSWRRLRD